MYWVATEDTSTCEVTEFAAATAEDVLELMDGYRVDASNPTRFHVHDTEDGHRIIYEGVTYKGGFGFDLWVARKYVEA